jgi:hypothetical protein
MSKLMENVKKAQQLVQTETAKVQQELAATEFDGYDEDETVRVVMTGNQEPKGVDITQAAMDAGAEVSPTVHRHSPHLLRVWPNGRAAHVRGPCTGCKAAP